MTIAYEWNVDTVAEDFINMWSVGTNKERWFEADLKRNIGDQSSSWLEAMMLASQVLLEPDSFKGEPDWLQRRL